MVTATDTSLTIAEAATRAGVSVHALRYYERAGLLTPIERNVSGHRRFTPDDVEWIVVCTRLRATGMPIRRIRAYAELVREGAGNEADRHRAARGPPRGGARAARRSQPQPRADRLQDQLLPRAGRARWGPVGARDSYLPRSRGWRTA